MQTPVIHALAAPLIDFDYTLLVQFGLFLVMSLLATKWLFRPYLKLRQDREDGIEGAREQAIKTQEKADNLLSDYNSRLASARNRAAEERRAIQVDAASQQRALTESAEAQFAEKITTAKQTLDGQVAVANSELANSVDNLATAITEKLLGRKI